MAWVVWVGPAGLVVLVVSVVTGPRRYPLRAALDKADSATGRTTPYIAVAHLIGTGLRQIGLEAALAVIHLPNARPAPGNKLVDRVEGSTVSLPPVGALATLRGMPPSATAQEALVARIAAVARVLVRAEPIV